MTGGERRTTMMTLAVGCGALFAWFGGLQVAGSSWGGGTGIILFVLSSLGMSSVAVVGVARGAALMRRQRIPGATLLAVCVVAGVVGLSAGPAVGAVQRRNFREFASRAQPLVEAIRAHERANGGPPESLQQLVPAYLSEVPRTGFGACPEFFYSRGDDAYDRGRWRLAVSIGVMPWDWEMLEYRPAQDYPERATRFGGWAAIVG